MKGLLLRNLYSLRIPVLIVAAIVLILSMSGSSSAAFVIPFAAMGIAVLPCPLFAADAQSRFESYRLTLPVKRRTIADAYYLTVLLLTVILLLFSLLIRSEKLALFLGEAPEVDKRAIGVYFALFAVCLLVVLRVIPWYWMLGILIAVLLIYDRKLLLKADFMLLLTFVAFFVFSGNLARIPKISEAIRSLMTGRAYLTSLLASQVISNVPAALLLSGFTDQSHALLLGVNIGGLGTPIASLASLISLKLYSHSEHAHTGYFLAVFTAFNLAFLLVLSAMSLALLH